MTKRFRKTPLVFISYAREDREKAYALFAHLRQKGLDPWIDTEKLLPGQQWRSTIKQIISESDFFLGCFSKRSASKVGFFQTELKEAYEILKQYPTASIFFIPVRLEECEIPPEFREYSWIDVYEPDGLATLVESIRSEWNSRNSERDPQVRYPLRDLLSAFEMPPVGEGSFRVVGSYTRRIGQQGRVVVPAQLRPFLDGANLLLQSPLSNCLILLPRDNFLALIDKLRALPLHDEQVLELTRRIAGKTVEVWLDRQGRIAIPKELLESAGLDFSVVFVGMFDRIELWDTEAWEERESVSNLI